MYIPNCDVSFAILTVFWSRVHQQRHVTTCLMKFAVGERNVAIRYKFCVSVVYYERSSYPSIICLAPLHVAVVVAYHRAKNSSLRLITEFFLVIYIILT